MIQFCHASEPAAATPALVRDFRMAAWLPPSRDAAILDVGCGFPSRLHALYELGFHNLHGVDLRAGVIDAARKLLPAALQLRSGDMFRYLEECPLSFDRILLFHVLEHQSKADGMRLLSLIAAHLAAGGACVVEVPNLANVLGMHMQASDLTHQTPFTEFSLAQLLEAAGFAGTRLICPVPRGITRGWHWRANRLLHRALFEITGVGPRPRCVCPALLMTACL